LRIGITGAELDASWLGKVLLSLDKLQVQWLTYCLKQIGKLLNFQHFERNLGTLGQIDNLQQFRLVERSGWYAITGISHLQLPSWLLVHS
jgi:hypothetical protein